MEAVDSVAAEYPQQRREHGKGGICLLVVKSSRCSQRTSIFVLRAASNAKFSEF